MIEHPRYGLSLPNRGVLFGATSVEELLELSEQAEASGAFASIWRRAHPARPARHVLSLHLPPA